MFLAPYFCHAPENGALRLTNTFTQKSVTADERDVLDFLQGLNVGAAVSPPLPMETLGVLFPDEESCRQAYADSRPPSFFPIVEQVEMTNACSYKCIICPRPTRMTRKVGYLSLTLLHELCRQIKGRQDFLSLHHFGESLLHSELSQAVSLVRRHGIHPGLSCNAASLKPGQARELLDAGLSTISFNLDSMHTPLYQKIRGSRYTVADNIDNINTFIKYNQTLEEPCLVTLQMVQMKENMAEGEQFLDLARKIGADRGVVVRFGQWDFTDAEAGAMATIRNRPLYLPPCPVRWQSISVLWDGRIVPCCRDYDGDLVIGDAHHDSLEACWNSEGITALRRNENQFERCNRCWSSWSYRTRQRDILGYPAFHREVENDASRKNLEWMAPGASERFDKVSYPIQYSLASSHQN